MKTQILRLEPHDDVISARDKMEWSQAGRILLVWPERGNILNRRIDLVLLQRHSQSLGAQMAVISQDSRVCYYAGELGIPVYKDLRQAQKKHWRSNRKIQSRKDALNPPARRQTTGLEEMRQRAHPTPTPWLTSPITRVAAFVLSVLAFLSIAAILLPSAEIRLTPQSKVQQITMEVRADPEIDAINLSGVIPSQTVNVLLSGSRSTPAKGSSRVPDQAATVDLLITNITDQVLSLPAGTVVRTPDEQPERFATIRSGQVPAGVGQSVSLPARALTPGGDGNVPAGSLTIFEDSLGTRLTATNPMPAIGGTDRLTPTPLASQREQLYDQLVKQLHQQALEQISQQIQPDDLLLTTTLTLTQVIHEEYDPLPNQPADRLNLAMTVNFAAQIVSAEDLKALAKGVLDANTPEGYHSVPDTVSIELLSEPELLSDSRLSWKMRVTQQVQAEIDESSAASLISGQASGEAIEKLLASLPLENKPSVLIAPHWWPRLPLLPFRIHIESR